MPAAGRKARRLLATVVSAAGAAAVVVSSAGPAAASPPTVTIGSPAGGSVLSNARATISGTVKGDSGLLGSGLNGGLITDLSLDVHSRAHPEARAGCGSGCGAALRQPTTSFSFTTPPLAFNGPYDLSVTATQGRLVGADSTTATGTFKLAVPPVAPRNVTAVTNPDGSVAVSWAPNPEPDLLRYQVRRRPTGGSDFPVVADSVGQSASTVTWVDHGPLAPGDFEYQVVALRPGADGGTSNPIGTASGTAPATVAAPGGGGSGPAVAPGAPGKPGAGLPGATDPTAGLALGALVPGGGGVPPSAGVPTVAVPADGPFAGTLPVGAAKAKAGGSGDGSDDVSLGVGSIRSDARSLLVPFAAGLLLCVVAFHVRLLNRRLGGGSGRAEGNPLTS